MNKSYITSVEQLSTREEYAIIGIIGAIFSVGSLSNLAICFVYKKVQVFPRLSSKLIINLAICDVLLCLHTGSMIYGLLLIRTGGPSRLFCDISGYIKFVLTFVSFAAVTLIMVNRYLTVVLVDRNKFSNINLVIAFPWVYHLCLGIGPLVGWSQYTFSYGTLSCTCRIRSSVSFSILIGITSMFGPLTVLVYCSTQIFRKLKQVKKIMQSNGPWVRKRNEIRGNIILFGVIVNYFGCAAPFIIVNLIELQNKDFTIPLRVDIATSIMAQLMPVINPIIFGFGNEKFRRAFRWIIKMKPKIRPANQELDKKQESRNIALK